MADLDTLRPEVQRAFHRADHWKRGDRSWEIIRAELLRLTDENARLLAANRDCVDHFEQMQAELAALKERIDGSRHTFLGPNMDRITFLAEDIGPVGKYALVKVEE